MTTDLKFPEINDFCSSIFSFTMKLELDCEVNSISEVQGLRDQC